MFIQTDPKYKSINLGNGTGTIYDYGCYLVSLCNGLNQKGYSYTPESLNQFFKDKNLWVGPYQNYVDVSNLSSILPDIFSFYERIDPWADIPLTQILLNKEFVVLGKVSAKPIGGTGDHYVLLTDIQDGIAVINDPWTGLTEKITNRWASFGNILRVDIFKVKPIVAPVLPVITDQTKLPIIDKNGNQMELQAVRSSLADQEKAITDLTDEVSVKDAQIKILQNKLAAIIPENVIYSKQIANYILKVIQLTP